ncbi:MAG: hypothetical protein JWQ38_3396 [Flavipsychrobacter sp.]|nr:hypothetical protein [Flavipsychrobacter sp.]
MKLKSTLIIVICLLCGISSFAQQKEKMTREEKDEKNAARMTRINNKNDYALFHKQILGLKEYLDERKKIPALQKANKAPVKVVGIVDSLEDDDTRSVLTGLIRQDIGDNTVNIYELTFDRKVKKITGIKRTPEAIEADKEEAANKEEKITTVKTVEKVVVKKKKSDDDDDDDTDEEKPAKGKSKTKDADED